MSSKKSKDAVDLSSACLQTLLDHLGITSWDALIAGDGSGSGWSIGAGWAAIVIERLAPNDRKILWGGRSSGTNNIAELSAYADALEWYVYNAHDAGARFRLRRVHIVSDSALIVGQGNRAHKREHQAHRWALIDWLLREHRLLAVWHWMDRDTTALNKLADLVSREARLALASADPSTLVENFKLSSFNPLQGDQTS